MSEFAGKHPRIHDNAALTDGHGQAGALAPGHGYIDEEVAEDAADLEEQTADGGRGDGASALAA
jgi:hypothetical protein